MYKQADLVGLLDCYNQQINDKTGEGEVNSKLIGGVGCRWG